MCASVRASSWTCLSRADIGNPNRLDVQTDSMFAAQAILRWGMKLGFCLALMSAATTVFLGQDIPKQGDSQRGIPFEVNRRFGSILIRAQVNGHWATLVVDTGSSHTILSWELVQVSPLALPHAPAPSKASGLVGRGVWSKATLEIGAMTWTDHRVLVTNDFQDLSKSVSEKVDGILGEDVLKDFNSVVIDFQHHRLLLLH